MVNINKAEEVAKFWGDRMGMMTMEEAGELIQAISKYERYVVKDEFVNNDIRYKYEKSLIDEIGDMYISLLALRLHYGLDMLKIEKRIDEKLNKKY